MIKATNPSSGFKIIYLIPFVLLALLLGMNGGLLRLGWEFPLSATAASHGLLMTGSFMGTLITLERISTMPNTGWRIFPLSGAISALFFALGWFHAGLAALLFANAGLLLFYFKQMGQHKELYWYLLLAGSLCWLIGTLLVWKTLFIPRAVGWWMAFLLFTIVGERLELTRFLPVPQKAFYALALFFGLVLLSLFLPFHEGGRWLLGLAVIGIGLWLSRYDMARITVKKTGYYRYIGTALYAGYGWLIALGLVLFSMEDSAFFYDVFVHAFFLGFAFSMIWAHAPLIFPSLIKKQGPAYHPIIWFGWSLFQITLLARLLSALLGASTLRQWFGMTNGLSIFLLFASIAWYYSVSPKPSSAKSN
ncbi:hypothetical protein QWY31_05895 [Cytophagales bacterium LB-30]|uniref:NnrS family protein n=1 Tax=Shiella aurantiaca TaxID=3058365 RepID=A0ABT8F3K7_9BACT|nr:hypothetical protein [Shiella aurantiaca]MDN4165025.1 hypothetical protein [Shiella aurantiaca]